MKKIIFSFFLNAFVSMAYAQKPTLKKSLNSDSSVNASNTQDSTKSKRSNTNKSDKGAF